MEKEGIIDHLLYMQLKGLTSIRGQGLLKCIHYKQLFTITTKQTAGTVVPLKT